MNRRKTIICGRCHRRREYHAGGGLCHSCYQTVWHYKSRKLKPPKFGAKKRRLVAK